jgi:hypothetical protein
MTIPSEILSVFEKETDGLKFGKVSIGLIVRDNHIHFEIDKHITFFVKEDTETKKR